jgi:hypothetical protein
MHSSFSDNFSLLARAAVGATGLVLSVALARADVSGSFGDYESAIANGWTSINRSATPNIVEGAETWGQGANFAAYQGDSFAGVGFTAGDPQGTYVSDWLISPELTLSNGTVISFYARQAEGDTLSNALELRLSLVSAVTPNVGTLASDVGSFTTLLGTTPSLPALALDGTLPADQFFPDTWTGYSATITGLSQPVTGRFAFRYVLPDTSLEGAGNGSYIGLDSVAFTVPSTIPEPSTAAVLMASVALVGVLCRRRPR